MEIDTTKFDEEKTEIENKLYDLVQYVKSTNLYRSLYEEIVNGNDYPVPNIMLDTSWKELTTFYDEETPYSIMITNRVTLADNREARKKRLLKQESDRIENNQDG